MIELSLSELFLWIWCIVATGLTCYFRHHAKMRHMMIVTIMMDEHIRNEMVASYKKLKEMSDEKL